MNPRPASHGAQSGPTGGGGGGGGSGGSGASTSASAGEVPPLRNSCEACAASKLRCSKEKPTCHRCAKRGLTCEYFATKRAGRKPGSRSSVNGGSTSSLRDPPCVPERMPSLDGGLNQSPEKLNDDLILLDPTLSTNFLDMSAVSDLCFTADGTDFGIFNTADLLCSRVDGGGSSSSSSGSTVSNSLTGGGTDGAASNNHDSLSTAFPGFDTGLPELLALSAPSSVGWNPPFPELESTEPPCACLAEAASFMTRLSHLSSTVCTTWATLGLDNVTRLRTVLDVVEQNKVTTNAVRAILNCPNFHDGSLLAIISFIIFKMLSLYAAIACKDPDLQDLPSTPARPTPQAESALPSPDLLDHYSLERSDPQHMAARIVLGELHRLRHLIAQLVEKLKSQSETLVERGEEGETQESMDLDCDMRLPLSAVMYEQLDLDLRRRLKALSWGIVDRMTRL